MKENFITNISEEEIVLAPPTELFEEAKDIAQNTTAEEKFPFALQYDANQKEFLLSLLQTAGAIVENDDEEGHVLATMMNMTQLAFIKRLDCVERVRTDEGLNPFLAEEAVSPKAVEAETPVETPVETVAQQNVETAQTEQVMTLAADEAVAIAAEPLTAEPLAANAEDGIAVASVSASARSTCCPSNADMASAQTIEVEQSVLGCICCPGAEQWFKFTVPYDAAYTIYTSGSLDTIGELSGCCLPEAVTNDDYDGRINFRIVKILCAGCDYYIRVSANGDATGNYNLMVTRKTLAEEVLIHSQRSDGVIVLEANKTYELPRGEGYGFLNAANTINAPFSVEVNPNDTADKRVVWYTPNTDIINISSGWYNGERYQTVTANKSGIAAIYAYDWNGYGIRASYTVTVDPREIIIVKRDGTFNEIILGSSGKVWKCINFDMINESNISPKTHPELFDRLYHNTYNKTEKVDGFIYSEGPILYTDQEMKLLYLIDPYGFSNYIQEYAKHVYNDLSELVNFKDSVFRTLFNKAPRYYARTTAGEWYDATVEKEQLSIHVIMSESELIFGTHPIYDFTTGMQIFTVLLQLLSLPVAFAKLASIPAPVAYQAFLKYTNLSFTLTKAFINEDYKIYIDKLVDDAKGNVVNNTVSKSADFNLNWAKELFKLSDSFEELEMLIADKPSFYREVFSYCSNEPNFRLFFEYNNGTIEEISEICDKLN